MSLESLKAALPDYAKDIRLNLGSLATEPSLSAEQRGGTFIAAALAARNEFVSRAIVAEFAPQLSVEAVTAARAAASIMAMNNIYYRFTHLVGGDYAKLPAKLRMNVMAKPGVDKATFELWSLAVSAINGCGMCMESHERTVRDHGLTTEQVQAAVRIASVVHAAAVTIDSDAAVQTDRVLATFAA
jgi:alkyl hydroperoxide reductase subunit D